MNRRFFIRSLISAVALAAVPLETLHAFVSPDHTRDWAIRKMTAWYNAQTRGRGSQYAPRFILLGRDLYDAYESQLKPIQRFHPTFADGHQWLAFKGSVVKRSNIRGYFIMKIAE